MRLSEAEKAARAAVRRVSESLGEEQDPQKIARLCWALRTADSVLAPGRERRRQAGARRREAARARAGSDGITDRRLEMLESEE